MMRRAGLFVPVVSVSLFFVACGSDDKPAGAPTQPLDTGVADTFFVQPNDTAAADSAANDTTTPTDTGGDTSVMMETTPGDTSMLGDIVEFTDVMSTKDTLVDAIKIDGDLPGDTSVTMDVAPMPDGMGGPDASPSLVPVGTTCTTNAECDPAGSMVGICSNNADPPDTIDPTPTCMARACATTGAACGAGGGGICVPGNRCVDSCAFGSSGAATGCAGKTVCNVYSFTRDGGGGKGVGSCRGGCLADGDCTAGQKCQVEDGVCVQTLVTYPNAFGTSCTSSSDCRCQHGLSKPGYCSKYCITGGAACPSGYTCDPGLPKNDTTGVLFTSVPTGLAGDCLKNCANDGDCTPYGGHCETNSVTGVKVCRIP